MTLIVALKSSTAIILAADSRGMIGDPRGLTAINDNQTKLFQIGNCGLGFAGASELGAALLDEYRKKGFDKPTPVDALMNEISQESSLRYNTWFGDIPKDKRPGVMIMLAGYRNNGADKPEPMIFVMASDQNFAPMLMGAYPAMTGIPQYAIYLSHRYYDPSISAERARSLAEYLISETASQETKVGGRIRMAEITPQNGYRELSEDEVRSLNQENAALNQRLRQFFLAGETK